MKRSALFLTLFAYPVLTALAEPPDVTIGYLPPGVKIIKTYAEKPSPAPSEPEVPEDHPAARHLDLFIQGVPDTVKPNAYLCVTEISADAKKFPTIVAAAKDLRALLAERPAPALFLKYKPDHSPARELPDFPFADAHQALRSHFTYIDAEWGSGYAEVVQFAQDETRATNELLCYYLQGISKDGRYYVSASFAISQPSLPATYEAALKADPKGTLASDIKKLNALPPDSFVPPLHELRKLIESITITDK